MTRDFLFLLLFVVAVLVVSIFANVVGLSDSAIILLGMGTGALIVLYNDKVADFFGIEE